LEKLWEKEIRSQRIYKGSLLGLRKDTVKLSSGKQSTREVVEHPGAVAVVALTRDREMVLVRQFRKPAGSVLLEVPAGVPMKGEGAEDCARRELEEETGFHARKVRKVWEGYASPGYSDEVIQYCLAEDMTLLKQKTEEDENIEVDLVDIELCVDMLKNGRIRDNKTMIGIVIADLFLKGELS
jgi:ADP-ribose pyrophosphatase